jgi:hypothetical protein
VAELAMRVFVWLSVLSERRTPEEISGLVGLDADSSWKAGETRAGMRVPERRHGWILESGLPPKGADLETHLESLLGRVRKVAGQLRALAVEEDVTVMCAIYTDHRVVIGLDPWVVREISELGAAVGIDIYYLPADAAEA